MPKAIEISIDEYLSKRSVSAHDGVVYRAAKMPRSFDAANRSANFIMTDETIDSYGDIVRAGGADLERFASNPICLLNHRHDKIIGTWSDVKKIGKRIEGVATLATEGTSSDVDTSYNLMSQGILRACSIGFMPKTIKRRVDDDGEPIWAFDILEWDLFECSIVSVPANPQALAKSMRDGFMMAKDTVEEILDTYMRTPSGVLINIADFEAAHKEGSGNKTVALAGKVAGSEYVLPAGAATISANTRRLASGFDDLPAALKDTADLSKQLADSVEKVTVDNVKSGFIATNGYAPEKGDGIGDVIIFGKGGLGPYNPSSDNLTDDVLKSFADLVEADDLVVLRDAENLKLVIERSGEVVEELCFPDAMTIKLIKEVQEKIATLVKERSAQPKDTISMKIDLDTTEVNQKFDEIEKRAEGFLKKFGRLFGTKTSPEVPVEEIPVPAKAAPSEEEKTALLERAAQIQKRISDSGLTS